MWQVSSPPQNPGFRQSSHPPRSGIFRTCLILARRGARFSVPCRHSWRHLQLKPAQPKKSNPPPPEPRRHAARCKPPDQFPSRSTNQPTQPKRSPVGQVSRPAQRPAYNLPKRKIGAHLKRCPKRRRKIFPRIKKPRRREAGHPLFLRRPPHGEPGKPKNTKQTKDQPNECRNNKLQRQETPRDRANNPQWGRSPDLPSDQPKTSRSTKLGPSQEMSQAPKRNLPAHQRAPPAQSGTFPVSSPSPSTVNPENQKIPNKPKTNLTTMETTGYRVQTAPKTEQTTRRGAGLQPCPLLKGPSLA